MNACPKCGSTEAHKASVVHASQTSSVNATPVGGGVGLGGAVGLGVAGTSGTSQSLLAQKAAPPKKPNHIAHGCVLYVVLFFVYAFLNSVLVGQFGSADSAWGSAFALIVLGGGAVVIIYCMRQLTKKQLVGWRQGWMSGSELGSATDVARSTL